jgi:hypothetical protein
MHRTARRRPSSAKAIVATVRSNAGFVELLLGGAKISTKAVVEVTTLGSETMFWRALNGVTAVAANPPSPPPTEGKTAGPVVVTVTTAGCGCPLFESRKIISRQHTTVIMPKRMPDANHITSFLET